MKNLIFFLFCTYLLFESCNSKREFTLDLFNSKIYNSTTLELNSNFKKQLRKLYFKNTYFLNDSIIAGLDYSNQEIIAFSVRSNDTFLVGNLKLNNLFVDKLINQNDSKFYVVSVNKIDGQEIVFQNNIPLFFPSKIKLQQFRDSTISVNSNSLIVTSNKEFYKIYNYQLRTGGKEPNYVDSTAFLVIGDKVKKIGTYSSKFYDKILDIRNVVFDFNDSTIFYIGSLDEELKKVNIISNLTSSKLVHKDMRPIYPKSKLSDLAYSRIYRANVELNVDLKICKNEYVVILKRLQKSDFYEKEKYKYFVFDKKLRPIYADTIFEPILPNIYSTKKGFRLINDSATKLFDYEF